MSSTYQHHRSRSESGSTIQLKMKQHVTDIFFDLDHTLWDFERNSALAFRQLLVRFDVAVDIDDFLETYAPVNRAYWKLFRENRISKPDLRYARLKQTFDTLGYDASRELIGQLSEGYVANLPDHNHLMDHSTEILQYLQLSYRLHIITNGFAEVQNRKMMASDIYHYFIHIVSSETVGVKKPDQRIFEFALDRAEVAPQHAVMIGDNLEADIQGAQNVGMHTIYFNPLEEQHGHNTKEIRHLSEIRDHL